MRSIFALPTTLLALTAYTSAASVTSTFSDGTLIPFATPAPVSSMDSPAPAPTDSPSEEQLELRQAQVATAAVTTAASQAAAVTTYWIETVLDSGATTYVEVVYTQTFASIPDQWASAGSGAIGLGTLTGTVGAVKTKRADATNAAGRVKGLRGASVAATVAAVAGFVGAML